MRGSKPLILVGVLALAGFLLHRILSRYSLDQLTAAVDLYFMMGPAASDRSTT